MANRYTTTEVTAVDALLKKVPRDVAGCLPYKDWEETPEWKLILKNHPPSSIRAFLKKRWDNSVIPINVNNSAAKPVTTSTPLSLNHAYNFCPGCGMKLN